MIRTLIWSPMGHNSSCICKISVHKSKIIFFVRIKWTKGSHTYLNWTLVALFLALEILMWHSDKCKWQTLKLFPHHLGIWGNQVKSSKGKLSAQQWHVRWSKKSLRWSLLISVLDCECEMKIKHILRENIWDFSPIFAFDQVKLVNVNIWWTEVIKSPCRGSFHVHLQGHL